jgi:DNA polymerase III delta prime subunit
MIGNEFLFTEKYRPHTVKDTILPKHLKTIFQKFVDQKNVPNLLLFGKSGVGKTTIAKAMLDELHCDYITINASKDGNIDILRTKIQQFASSMSLVGGRKYVILDEADYLNPNSTQPALRNFMEEYAKNCGFIYTCNFKGRIIDALHSRCAVIDFKIDKADSTEIAKQFFKVVLAILDKEKVEYDSKAVASLITKHYPDFRRVLNELQTYSASGKIDSGILANFTEESFKKLIGFLKEKNFSELRKWIGTTDPDDTTIFRKLYDAASELLQPQSVPQLVLAIAKYQYQAAFVADHQINLVACLVEIMVECVWK